MMTITKSTSLAPHTSFNTGGTAEVFVVAETPEDVAQTLKTQPSPYWLLGSGANTLISDKGLPGTTIKIQLEAMTVKDNEAIVESGANWDEFVNKTIDEGLWGVELMSGIPGTIGAAVVGNIAAYGQSVADTLQWIEVIDHANKNPEIERIPATELNLGYRSSRFSKGGSPTQIILRACFVLSLSETTELQYQSAVTVANELGKDIHNLHDRRDIILEARRRAGSLLDEANRQKTAGSFFKNPLVSAEKAEHVMQFEERSVSKAAIKQQNQIHGGDTQRVSAAHVILAAGFERGQSWGPVRIHPEHALKIENTGNATSQQIYNVAQEIMQTVKEKLDIDLEPEVRFMGDFD